MCVYMCAVLAAGCWGSRKTVHLMVASGLLPAMEQLFRQVPVVSPAHVTAADLLVSGRVCGACLEDLLTARQGEESRRGTVGPAMKHHKATEGKRSHTLSCGKRRPAVVNRARSGPFQG